jgi:hypothetical protein
MGEYPIKRGHKPDLRQIMKDCFNNLREENKMLISNFGALKKITAHTNNKLLFVETEMKKTDDETSLKTIKAYNRFLGLATGYTAKERIKKARAGKE